MCEAVIIFGSGERANHTIEIINKVRTCKVIEIWDNNEKKWGVKFGNVVITKPHNNVDKVDKILICSVYYDEIYKQLVENLHIPPEKIVNHNYCWESVKQQIIKKYMLCEDSELRDILRYLKNHDLTVFNYDFTNKYDANNIEVNYDMEKGLFYTLRNKKRMYLSRKFQSEIKAKEYINSILIEQDNLSPHKYLDGVFKVNEHDVIIDAGAAEGFFVLDVIDRIDFAYIIEADKEWVEALEYTFADYSQKVLIVNKFVGAMDSDDITTIDSIVKNKVVNMIKMDVEGWEMETLKGAYTTLKNNSSIQILACSYHKHGDEENISNYLKKLDFNVEFSNGFMFFGYLDTIDIELRRGIVRARKGEEVYE